jgi:tRNA pseudouridine38-40 synthase
MDKTFWKLRLAYDGADFHGWQVQPVCSGSAIRRATIQGTLAQAIASVTGERVLPQGSGRTDAGVHAAAQVASFALAVPIPAENLRRALNRALPPSIRVLSAEPVLPSFHARHSAVGKLYRYRILQGAVCSPFLARYVAECHWQLDLSAMQQAARAVLGEHDFTSFAAHDPDRATRRQPARVKPDPSNIRRIDLSHWSCTPGGTSWNETSLGTSDRDALLFTYEVRGSGFLHHMVRNLVGTFLEVGRGRIPPARVDEILTARDRSLAGPTAPARGLCLMEVLY